jgi:hypothetical protein
MSHQNSECKEGRSVVSYHRAIGPTSWDEKQGWRRLRLGGGGGGTTVSMMTLTTSSMDTQGTMQFHDRTSLFPCPWGFRCCWCHGIEWLLLLWCILQSKRSWFGHRRRSRRSRAAVGGYIWDSPFLRPSVRGEEVFRGRRALVWVSILMISSSLHLLFCAARLRGVPPRLCGVPCLLQFPPCLVSWELVGSLPLSTILPFVMFIGHSQLLMYTCHHLGPQVNSGTAQRVPCWIRIINIKIMLFCFVHLCFLASR